MKQFIARHAAAALILAGAGASAAPGAHGPNGEHLDAPGSAAPASSTPRFEARSDAFELVGRLAGGELSMFINRYETSAPVERAQVEIELGSMKAAAPFQLDQGDYAVVDEAFLKAVSTPGEHALVVTVIVGDEADLLEGRLQVADSAAHDDHHAHDRVWLQPVLLAAGAAVLLALAALALRRRSARAAGAAR